MFDKPRKIKLTISMLEKTKKLLTEENWVNHVPNVKEGTHCILTGCWESCISLNLHPKDIYGPAAILRHLLREVKDDLGVAQWNDQPSRTFEDIQSLLSEAIEYLSSNLEKTG